ncbi:DUF3604 domain-containing protein [Poseidonocella sp. HB161398]|uniref:DUF3604 domain-containing protein n=1 Tax=Poseidonocella sp. HB161398 TaxID=2320855 RepID=UPI0035154476
MRRRVGAVADSDGHKGRPGASFLGAHGGLTRFLAEENTRDAAFEAIRPRRTHAPSGPRVAIDLVAGRPAGGTLIPTHPPVRARLRDRGGAPVQHRGHRPQQPGQRADIRGHQGAGRSREHRAAPGRSASGAAMARTGRAAACS